MIDYAAMTLNEYQALANKFARYPGRNDGMAGVSYLTLGMTGEAGEVANKVKKTLRDDGGNLGDARRAAILDELGDTLWYLTQLATELGCDLSDIVRMNREKLESRSSPQLPPGYGG